VGQISADNIRQSDLFTVRLDQSEALRESISGVSTDDEMMDLTRFQKQFEANGKVIKTVTDLMDTVLQLVR
jgi:flagellar hook-associated protein 1 FlgK